MRVEGRVEVGPYGGDSKSARQHQAFLVTATGERLLLRRDNGPGMRDAVLEALDGMAVVAEGQRRDRLFLATDVRAAPVTARLRPVERGALGVRWKSPAQALNRWH